MKVLVSLVTYNHTPFELEQVIQQLSYSEDVVEIMLIDNSETKKLNSLSSYPKVNYNFVGSNLGYGKAHNIGINKSVANKVPYHLVINPDILLDTKVIHELVTFMDKNTNIGLVMPRINYRDGSLQYLCKKLPTPFDLIGRRFIPDSLKKIFQSTFNSYELKDRDYNQQMDVPNLSGCFMFMRTSVLTKIGGFDERYFMYLEDTDLSRRIGEVSRTVYYPNVSVIHGYAKDSYKSLKLLKYHINSAFAYFNKWGWFFDSYRTQKNKQIQ
jgi:GT2 family glycosyltransferase